MLSERGQIGKTCTGCGEYKPLTDYHRANAKMPKRRSKCKVCCGKIKDTEEYKQSQRIYAKSRRAKNPEEHQRQILAGRKHRTTTGGRASCLVLAAKHRAKAKGLEFEIFKEYVQVILNIGVCQRTGIPFDMNPPPKGKAFNPYAPSIDRKNPKLGYTFENTQIVCNAYNMAKHEMTDEQFLAFCKLVLSKNNA